MRKLKVGHEWRKAIQAMDVSKLSNKEKGRILAQILEDDFELEFQFIKRMEKRLKGIQTEMEERFDVSKPKFAALHLLLTEAEIDEIDEELENDPYEDPEDMGSKEDAQK